MPLTGALSPEGVTDITAGGSLSAVRTPETLLKTVVSVIARVTSAPSGSQRYSFPLLPIPFKYAK
ncbi:MAG: hypothetical protein GXY20_06340 [Clostridiales bacterium]|nr:hypothetical protein [Clostridiales bacterium]